MRAHRPKEFMRMPMPRNTAQVIASSEGVARKRRKKAAIMGGL
jgi:hypothetical protein